jgi:hypothetical protein
MATWTYMSYAMSAASVSAFVYSFIIAGHDHHDHPPKYEYLSMRLKPFPWGPSDCALFDRKCVGAWKKAQAAL